MMLQAQQIRGQKRKLAELDHGSVKSPTKQELFTEEHQSHALVQTVVLSSIAIIAFIRKLLPYHCFEKRSYNDIRDDAHRLFRDYHDRTAPDLDANEIENAISRSKIDISPWILKVLARGKSSSADQILDWMNIIFEGVMRKNLCGFQLSVFADEQNPSHVLESYDFTFQYNEHAKIRNPQLVGVAIPGIDGKPVTITSARAGVEAIIHHLYGMEAFLPDLSTHRYLRCHLFHRSGASHTYQPSGFRPCDDLGQSSSDDELWPMTKIKLGAMNSGFHTVALELTYKTFKDGIKLDREEIAVADPVNKEKGVILPAQNFSMNLSEKRLGTASPEARQDGFMDSNQAPTREVAECETGLSDREGASSVGGCVADSFHETLIATQEIHSETPRLSRRMTLIPSKRKEMEIKRREILRSRSNDYTEDKIHCQCEFDGEEGEMLRCICCDTRQHCHCYGFMQETRKDDFEHFCYECLFGDTEEKRLDDLKRLAHIRRALWISYEQGRPRSKKAFAKLSGYDSRTTAQILQQMQEEGYLTYGSKSRLVFVNSNEQKRIRELDYCNPMTSIKICFADPDVSTMDRDHSNDEKGSDQRLNGATN